MVFTRTGTTILTEMIVDSTIESADFANDAIGTAKIAANGVQASSFADDAVGTAKIAAGRVQACHIAADAVGTAKIAAGRVQACHLANDAVGTAKIAANGVRASSLHASALDSHLIFGSAQVFNAASNTASYAITGASLRFAWGTAASEFATKIVTRCIIVSDSIMRFVVISATDRSLRDLATTNTRISYVAVRT